LAESRPPRFAADCRLGTLAKWLRILGHDVAYERRIEDTDLVALAEREGRTLLTADRRLARRRAAPDHILITSQVLDDQIRQVLRERRLAVDGATLLGRCLECNRPTDPIDRETARAEVPVYVYRTQSRFTRCGGCGRVFWRATHVTRMLDRLEASTGGRPAEREDAGPIVATARRRAPARRALPRPDAARLAAPPTTPEPAPLPRAVAVPFVPLMKARPAPPVRGRPRPGPRRRRP
jgi:uncharacterized protein with PIN domain